MNVIFTLIFFALQAWSQNLYVAPEVDLQQLAQNLKGQLAATRMLQKAESIEVRNEIMEVCQNYLEKMISPDEFDRNLNQWSQSGFTPEEREILLDTFQKSTQLYKRQNEWICRILPSQNCSYQTFDRRKLPISLQGYEGFLLDAIPYPSRVWDQVKLVQARYSWVFVSSKYQTYHFVGTWEELQKQVITTEAFVSGSCENPKAVADIQSVQNQLYYGSNCLRPSLPASDPEPSLYEQHKKAIWWTVGIVIGVGVFNSFKNKSLVIDKPGFM